MDDLINHAAMPLTAQLDNIIVLAHQAKAALEDEHEGNTRRLIASLERRAVEASHLVHNW
jgi:hypothetical protein